LARNRTTVSTSVSSAAKETDLAFGHLRISYQLTTVDGGRTRFQRDLAAGIRRFG